MKKPTILRGLSSEFLYVIVNALRLLFSNTNVSFIARNQNPKKVLSFAMMMVGIVVFMPQLSYGQVGTKFSPRLSDLDGNKYLKVKGDIKLIGNTILTPKGKPLPFNDEGNNNNLDAVYLDVDGVDSTVSSSSANLVTGSSCKKILFAGLYWSAMYPNGESTDMNCFNCGTAPRDDWNQVKFTVPGIASALPVTHTITASKTDPREVIFKGNNNANPFVFNEGVYVCFKDVTSILQNLPNADGTYTVADLRATTGLRKGGAAGGWTLVVIYESPTLPSKYISVFDGAQMTNVDAGVNRLLTVDIPVKGFQTLPSPFPVEANIGVAALDGDKSITGDGLRFREGVPPPAVPPAPANSFFTPISNTLNPGSTTPAVAFNFFNATITNNNAHVTTRNPASENNLGFDIDCLAIPNGANQIIHNDATEGTLQLFTDASGDGYAAFLATFAVDIIEPKIILTKAVKDGAGNPANNTPVGLGSILKYEIEFQNIGNDNAKSFTITDKLPANTIFDYPTDIEQVPTGVTHTYNATTRTITFTIPDNLVLKNGNISSPIRFKVKVVPTCENLTEPCNNTIKNTAKSKYTGDINNNNGTGFGEDSYASYSACTISVPESTNFLVGVDDCRKRNNVLCGDNVTLSATGGYASYSWSTSPTGTPVIGTSQTLTVTKSGTYYVKNTATPPCVNLEEIITVADYAAKPANPLIEYADNKNPATDLIDECVNDGSVLPKIFLCGDGVDVYKDINLSSLGATKITWETTTCVPPSNLSDLCANVSPTCNWTTAAPDGNTFRASTAGQYRVSIYFGGCFSRFYFNVYKNLLEPTATTKDIICGNNGSITIGGISGAGYEYSLTKTSGYQSSNTFSIATAGTYTVYIRQVGVVTNPCIFEVKGIPIYKIDFNPIAAPSITQPLCHNGNGNIKVYGKAYNGAQYTYELFKDGVSVGKVINSTSSEYEFLNKVAGEYTYTVTTLDGCSYNGTAKIIAPAALTALASITKPLTCVNGEITVTPSNGTSPYYYYVNGALTAQTDPKIVITTAGTYTIKVLDKNNCEFTIPSVTVNANPKPNYTIIPTNILCYGYNTGEIKFNVSNANGYALAYSINNGVTYVANGTFSSLPPGTYTPVLKYSLSGVDCLETLTPITITQPADALTASMGVSELAGCGPDRKGKVRITNPQGGTPFPGLDPYRFSFDNQATWTTVNDEYKAPGTYTLYVKDFNGCIFSGSVTLDPEPPAPQINVDTPVEFSCDGTATSTVTVTNPGGSTYTYNYYRNGVPNTPITNNVFTNVPAGPHAIKVEYKLNTAPTFSNLLYENFGYGEDTTSPGMNAAYYCFERQVVATQCKGSTLINDGDYSVTARVVNIYGEWMQPGDRTPPTVPPTPKGRCLVVNIGSTIPVTEILYEKVIKNIIPNQPIRFELYAMNLLKKFSRQFDPDLRVALVDATGKEISFYNTGNIPKSEQWENYPKTPIPLNPEGNTTLKFIVRSNVRQTGGNDVAIDDITVYQLPATCISSKEFTIVVPTGKAFSAQIAGTKNVTCNGLTNGEVTITADNFDPIKGFEYSTNNGVTWQTSTTSPITIKNLPGSLYKVVVRPVGATVANCSKSFDVTISVPAALTINASVTKPATCTTGATITATGGGGTPAYEYELRQGTNVIVPYTNNGGVFTNVPPLLTGNYTVFVKDANSCPITVGQDVPVTAAPPISAAVVPSTAMCFDPTTGAKINVAITGGVAPYSYQTSLNGGAFSASSATFTGLTFTHTAAVTGNYVFRVTDKKGCYFDTTQQVINAKVTANASVTTDLDCDPAPNDQAIISGTISDGTAPFTVVLTSGQTTGTLVGPVGTTTTFTYTTGVSGTYQFEITDAIGCKTTTSATINAKVAVTAKATVTDVKCNGENNGSVILEALTGVSPYTFAITVGTATLVSSTNTTANYSGLAPGTYKYTVTDKKNCQEEFSFEVKQPDAIEINASIKTPYTCDSEATIEAIATKGNGGFTYVLKRTVATVETTVATNTTGLFPNLSVAGSYTVTATDAKGCFLTSAPSLEIVALNPPTNPVFTEKPITCKLTELTSEVTISVTGGKGNLKYEITAPLAAVTSITSATTPVTFTGLTAGAAGTTYAFKVTDENNCSVTGTYTVKDVLPVIVNGSLVANVTCKTAADGKLKFTVSGNAGVFTYELRNSLNVVVPILQSTQTGNVIDYIGLAADTYTLTVTNPSTECKATKVLKVDEPSVALAITAPTISPITCLTNGTVVINTVGGWGNNRYTLTQPDSSVVGPQSTASFNVTQPGLYTISVTDLNGNGCTKTDTFTMAVIVTPSASIDLTLSDLCYDTAGKATIVVTPTVPSPTYMYSINNGTYQSNGTFGLLDPGSYIVRVKDTSTGCILTLAAQPIAQELKFNAVLDKSANCLGQNIEIKGTVSGGTVAYTYTVTKNGGAASTPIAVTGTTFVYTDLTADTTIQNTYLFTLTDASLPGCSLTSTVIVAPKTNPEFTATPNSTILCNGEATGSITVVIDPTKGASPYVIDVLNTTTSTPYGTKTTGLPAGFYTVKVTDAKGCFTILTGVEIKEPNPIIIDFEKKDLKCVGGGVSQGEIIIKGVTGGTGLYNYYVTGINYSEKELGTNGGSAVFRVVNFGLYQIRVVDANGCSEIISNVTIAAPPGYLDINIVTTATCAGGAATVTVGSAFPSTGPFHFNKYTGPGQVWTADGIGGWQGESPLGSKSTTFTGLIPGITYSFIVYDEITNCYYYQTATTPIPTTTSLALNNVVANNRTCFGSNDGSVSFDIVNNYASSVDVSYQVYEALSNLPITGLTGTGSITAGATLNIVSLGVLPVGSYYVLVQETSGPNTGCGIATSNFNIKESVAPLTLNANSPKNDNCGIDKGIIEAFGQGGTTIKENLTATPPISAVPYLYQVFVDNGTLGVIDALLDMPPTAASFTVASHTSNTFNKEAGHYIVYVRDAYGCIEYKFVEVKLDPEPVITALVNSACAAQGAFVIDIENTTVGGITPYTYSLDGGEFVAQTDLTFSYNNISSGDHSVEVKDFNGCTFKVTLPTIAEPLGITASFTTPPTCKVANGEITAVVTGGSPAPASPANHFEYTLINNTVVTTPNVIQQDNAVFTNQAAGNYTVQVKDLVTGCTKSTTLDLLVPTDVALLITDISTTPVDCNALNGTNNNGTLTVNLRAVNDNPDYTYALSGTAIRPAQPSNVFKDLTPGTYDVTVTSGSGCQVTVSGVIIADPVAVTATATATPFSCAVDPAKTTAVVEGFGGTGTYTFSTDGFNYFTSNSTPVADNKYTFNLVDNSAIQDPIFYVKDSNGCVQTTKLTTPLNPLPKLSLPDVSFGPDISCINLKQEMNVVINGGTNTPNPFTYNVYQDGLLIQGPTPVVGTTFTYDAHVVGSFYEFEIIDNNTTCRIKSNALTVPNYNTMTVTASAFKNVDCANNATGQIEINISNYTGAYNYKVFNGATEVYSNSHSTLTSNPFVIPFGLLAGNDYTVVVTQTAYPSCIKTSNPVAITEPAALDLSGPFVTVKNQNCNTTGAVVTVDDTKILGGKRDYTYVFVRNGSGALPPAGDFKSTKTATFATTVASTDTVVVWVKDANGCYSFVRVPISLDPMPTVTATVASQCPSPTGYTINALGTGVGTLQYSLDGNSFQPSSSLSVTSPGDYDVWVKDANGCIANTALKVKILKPLQLLADVTLSTCTAADGEVTLTVSGGSAIPANYEYKIGFGGTYGPSNVFGGLAASATPYTFYVRDISTVPACEKMVEVTMFLPNTAIGFVLDPTNVTCYEGSDGTITVNMAPSDLNINNNPIYSYALTGTTVGGVSVTIPTTGRQPSPLFSGLKAGSYTVTVTSGRGCPIAKPIVVDQPARIVLPTITPVPFGCTSGNARNLATITVDPALVTGGSSTYLNYEFIKNGTQVQFGLSNIYNEGDLSGGSYIVKVYDSKGCFGTSSLTTPIIIAPYVQLDKINVNVTRDITCTNLENIDVSVSAIGGSPTNLQFTVQDVTYDNSVTPPAEIRGTAYSLPPVSVVAGVARFTNLPVGNYLITVKNLDTNCEIIGVHYVNEPNTFDLTIDNVVDVKCLGGADGSARVTLIDTVITTASPNQAGPFSYTITGPSPSTGNATSAGPINLSNLAAGTYTITAVLTASPFCTVSKNFTITGPNVALAISETHTAITCVTGNNDGSISATATGGWPGGYEFQLERDATVVTPWSSVSEFNGLTPGNYVVKVRDFKDCEVSTTVPLVLPTPIAFTTTTTNAALSCKGDRTASISVSLPTGGQGTNYLYTLNTISATPMISSGPQADPVFTNLGSGTYTVTVTDGWGCGTTSTTPIVITEPTEVVASLVLATTQTCLTKSTITLSATGGTGTYTYSADGTFNPSTNLLTYGTFVAATTIINVPVGSYRYYVRDANQCVSVVSNDVTIEPLPTLTVDLNIQNAKIYCRGDANGVIVATATGGLGNYVYTLLDGAGAPIDPAATQLPAGNFTQLPAGSYRVRVDSEDCYVISTGIVTISEPLLSVSGTAVPTAITCNGAKDGIITVTASGGTGAIKYAIEPRLDQFFDTGVFDELAPGTYQLIAQDENGCFELYSATITEPQPIFVNTVAGSEDQELCFGDNNAAFSINIAGGVIPYSVALDDINGSYLTGAATQNVFNFIGLTGGDHTVYIKDANGCTAEWLVALDPSVKLGPQALVAYGCDNNAPSNTVTVTLDASITNPADVDYALDGATVFQASNIFKNVAPGFHTITARHTNGCEKTTLQFEVLGFTALAVTLSDGGLNEIVATATGGAGNYRYSFDGGITFSRNNKLIYYKSDNYTVIVRDNNGCEQTASRYFEFIDIKIPNVFSPNGDGNNDTWTPTNTINYKDLTISVFDRYGRKVDTLREGQGWDGKYNGLELPTGDYWYILKLKNVQDDREFVGHFTLMR